MSDKIYLDTNILVYLFSDDEPEKQQIARKLVCGHSCITGINNLNEMNCVLVQKKKLSFAKTEWERFSFVGGDKSPRMGRNVYNRRCQPAGRGNFHSPKPRRGVITFGVTPRWGFEVGWTSLSAG